jgi:undecaprenyl-diphosphatase
MQLNEKILLAFLLLLYLLLARFNSQLEPFNLKVRRFIERTRPMRLRPMMILTHRYNDVLSLSLQLIGLALLIGLFWHDWKRSMVLTTAMFIQTTAVTATKQLAAVNRPPQDHTHVIMRSGSYPSGHTAASLTFAILTPAVLAPFLAPAIVTAIMIYLLIVAFMTAYGRLFLDVHWITDIIGGWLISAVTLLLVKVFLL